MSHFKTSKYLKLVEEEAVNQGFFKDRPVKLENRLTITLAIPLWILAFVYLFLTLQYYHEIILIWLPSIGIWAAGFLPIFLRSGGLTEKGFVEATKWRSFYRYLKITLRQKNLSKAEISKWNDYLPYAQAFLLTEIWLKTARLNNISPPSWYNITFENEYISSKKVNFKPKTDMEYFHMMVERLYTYFNDHRR
jgi:hypothetical protein